MSLRLHELHPMLVHFPLALLPLAVAADLAGRATGRRGLLGLGRGAIGVAAAGAVGSVVTGLIAGAEVNVEGRSRDMLMTHRNLNVAATLVTIAMALWRRRQDRPSAAYLGTGLAGIGVVGYTAYLGGELVYQYGVGVGPAKGVWRPDAPKLRKGETRAFARDAAVDVWHGVKHMAEELEQGKIVPALVSQAGAGGAARELPAPSPIPSTARATDRGIGDGAARP
jgi:uncharacterized membrane protein